MSQIPRWGPPMSCFVVPQPKDFQVAVRIQKISTFKQLESENFYFFALNIKKQYTFFCIPGRREKQVCTCGVGGSVFVSVWVYLCVFVTCEEENESLPFWKKKEKKKTYVHINAVLVCVSLKDGFSCLSCTLLGAIMERAVGRIALFGLLLALVTTLPNKVRSQNLKDRVTHCEESGSICCLIAK